jgi:hypothetical protein
MSLPGTAIGEVIGYSNVQQLYSDDMWQFFLRMSALSNCGGFRGDAPKKA